jgi:hypothetical protein
LQAQPDVAVVGQLSLAGHQKFSPSLYNARFSRRQSVFIPCASFAAFIPPILLPMRVQ